MNDFVRVVLLFPNEEPSAGNAVAISSMVVVVVQIKAAHATHARRRRTFPASISFIVLLFTHLTRNLNYLHSHHVTERVSDYVILIARSDL